MPTLISGVRYIMGMTIPNGCRLRFTIEVIVDFMLFARCGLSALDEEQFNEEQS